VFQHLRAFFKAYFLAFGFRHRAVFIRVNAYTPGAYNRDYDQAQHISEHLQFPPIFTFVSKPTVRQILPARSRKFYAKILQTCRGIIAYIE
jgi:hypothetical protein